MLDRMLSFTEQHERSLDQSFAPGHITASAWVVDQPEAASSVLLTHHHKLDRWFQLGGHLEGVETVAEGALREAREESGVHGLRLVSDAIFDVDIHLIPARGSVSAHYHYDVRFLLQAPPEAPLITSSESRSLAWVPLSEAHTYNSSESILRMVRKSLYGNARV